MCRECYERVIRNETADRDGKTFREQLKETSRDVRKGGIPHSQLRGLGSRRSSCARTDDEGVVAAAETDNAADSGTLDLRCQRRANRSQGSDSGLRPCCRGSLSSLRRAGGKEGKGEREVDEQRKGSEKRGRDKRRVCVSDTDEKRKRRGAAVTNATVGNVDGASARRLRQVLTTDWPLSDLYPKEEKKLDEVLICNIYPESSFHFCFHPPPPHSFSPFRSSRQML